MTKITQIDPNTVVYIQSRAEMNPALIEEYAAMMAGGVQFDPAEGLQDDNGQVFVWDGAHRTEAARQAGQQLAVRLEPGSRSEAEWLALSANQKHGLRRSRADKQRVVRRALRHPNGVQLSNREIARHCGVDHKTVGRLRGELETSGDIPRITERTVTRNGTTYQIDTKKLTQAAPVSPSSDREPTNNGGRPEQLPSRPASKTANGSDNGRQQSPSTSGKSEMP